MNKGEIITWCQNWLINTFHPTNAKEFEILGRAVIGCFKISVNELGGISSNYGSGIRHTNADWRASELVDRAIKEYLLK